MTSIDGGSTSPGGKSVTMNDDLVVSMLDDEQSVNGEVRQSRTTSQGTLLSEVGKMYDVDGDGKLDEAEQAMRDLDKTGRGYLTNEKVYEMIIE